MRCRAFTMCGLACLYLGLVVLADDLPRQAGGAIGAGRRPAPALPPRFAQSPIPTQVWWTDRAGDFVVYEGSLGRLTVFDSWTRRRDPIVRFLRAAPISDWTVPAPNGAWSVLIDHRQL